MKQDKRDIFISYLNKDKVIANEVYRYIEAAGMNNQLKMTDES